MKNGIEYILFRSKRKTISVEITEAGKVRVRAPRWSPKWEIEAFLLSHEAWIREQQAKMAVNYVESVWTPKLTDEELKALKKSARADILSRIEKWAPVVAPDSAWAPKQLSFLDQLGVAGGKALGAAGGAGGAAAEKSPRLTIGKQKTLWGSCTPDGNLSFNCLLMLAPEDVRDYVVVHELCHLKHLNHSHAFWNAVERALPDYRNQKKWLKENGHTLLARLT